MKSVKESRAELPTKSGVIRDQLREPVIHYNELTNTFKFERERPTKVIPFFLIETDDVINAEVWRMDPDMVCVFPKTVSKEVRWCRRVGNTGGKLEFRSGSVMH